MTATTNAAIPSGLRCIRWVAVALLSALLQLNKVFVNGRLLRWPPFAKGSLSGLGTEVAVVPAYEGLYRALAGDATIPGDRPVRPGLEKTVTPKACGNRAVGAQQYDQSHPTCCDKFYR